MKLEAVNEIIQLANISFKLLTEPNIAFLLIFNEPICFFELELVLNNI